MLVVQRHSWTGLKLLACVLQVGGCTPNPSTFIETPVHAHDFNHCNNLILVEIFGSEN